MCCIACASVTARVVFCATGSSPRALQRGAERLESDLHGPQLGRGLGLAGGHQGATGQARSNGDAMSMNNPPLLNWKRLFIWGVYCSRVYIKQEALPLFGMLGTLFVHFGPGFSVGCG